MTPLKARSLDLSIVIPVFNSEKTIEIVIKSILDLKLKISFEFILVDDCSSDRSVEVISRLIRKYKRKITLITLAKNFGEHNAVMAGLSFAKGNRVIIMDDDLQNPPREISKLYYTSVKSDYDVIYTRYKKKEHNLFRNLGSYFANITADILLDKPKKLYLSSFKILKINVVKNILSYQGPYPYIDGLIFQSTSSVSSMFVDHFPRNSGESNYTVKKLIRLWMTIAFNFSVKPLRFSLFIGLIAFLVSIILMCYSFLDFIATSNVISGWTSTTILISFFGGLNLMFIGLMSEYIGRIFLTTNKRPQFIIKSIFKTP